MEETDQSVKDFRQGNWENCDSRIERQLGLV